MSQSVELNTAVASQRTEEIMVELRKVNKWFGEFHVLRDIDLTVKRGERYVVCGPSGSDRKSVV